MTGRRILVTGGSGQVGLELARLEWPDGVSVTCPTRKKLDLSDSDSVRAFVANGPWSCIINSAAYTAVDAAEDDVAGAFLANSQGPAWLAEAAVKAGVPIIHLSTDYVFDGTARRPYREDDRVSPISAYGASKLAGELAVRAANPRSVILRTAWVLSAHRHNFLKTMLRLGAERPRLNVVADQVGSPTSAASIAAALKVMTLRLLDDPEAPVGVYHFCNAGEASWHELAQTIFTLAEPFGYRAPEIVAISSVQYPTLASRPTYSRLDTSKIERDYAVTPSPWRAAVAKIVAELLGTNSFQKREM